MQRTSDVPMHQAHALLWCTPHATLRRMIDKELLKDLGQRLSDAARASPAQDLEKNLRALLGAFFDRFDVVLREDFDVQRKLLERAEGKLAALEARVAELERKRQ